jgi:GDP-4-dehydro-6-deoxy-D-mannose reductase
MRIAVTGATGFAGRWLVRELEATSHEVMAAPGRDAFDLATGAGILEWLGSHRPDAIAHLAGVSFGPEARLDPQRAHEVNVGGTRRLLAALDDLGFDAAVLVVGSSEAYGSPRPEDLPLSEDAPLRAITPYGLSKLHQERAALEARGEGRRIVVVRPFNHTGPGQREVFVAPAMARRVLDLRRGEVSSIRAGSLDVRRDIGDVRDTVRAYRLLLEALVDGRIDPSRPVYNVATERATSIRELVQVLCEIAGTRLRLEIDPDLVRPDDPPEIRGSAAALRNLTGWVPTFDLRTTLGDLLLSLESRPHPPAPPPPSAGAPPAAS